MLKNVGSLDQIVRVAVAVVLATLYLTGAVTGTAGVVVIVLAGLALITGLFRFYPAYRVCGLSTCRKGA
jgi:hypothetical protein